MKGCELLNYSHEKMGIIKSQENTQVIKEENKIICTHIKPYTTKTTKWQESLHTS
jgi:hypothetical protein